MLDDSIAGYNDNALVIDFNGFADSRLQITSWDKGLQVSRWTEGAWVLDDYDPELPLVVSTVLPDHLSLERFVADVPDAMQRIVIKFQLHQLTTLKLLNYFPGALELGQSTPLLLWLIADRLAAQPFGYDNSNIGQIFFLKRTKILELLGYGSSKSILKFIAKIDDTYFTERSLNCLKNILRLPALEMPSLRYIKRVKAEHLLLFDNYCQELKDKFIRNILCWDDISHIEMNSVFALYVDVKRLAKSLDIQNLANILKMIKSKAQLQRLHDKWLTTLNRQKADEKAKYLSRSYGNNFPEPPLPGSDNIIPIKTVHDLILEGDEMHHCAASYADDIFLGHSYIYKVIKPERCTLEINPRNISMGIRQFYLAHNKKPSEKSYKVVMTWLKDFM